MLNPHIHNSWVLIDADGDFPSFDVPVYVLIENDVLYGEPDDAPFIRYATLISDSLQYQWKLLDYSPLEEEEILQQCYTVVAWRPAS